MREIIVKSKTLGNHTILVSNIDYKWAMKHKWSIKKGHTTFYAKTKLSKTKWAIMHRLLKNAKKGDQVDHIDHNGLNNTRSNLRLCSIVENHRNGNMHRDNASGFKGVSFDKRRNKFKSRIFYKKEIWLGHFTTAIDAAKAYNVAALRYFGTFAQLNQL